MSRTTDRLSVLLRLPRRKRIYLISFPVLLLAAIIVGLDNSTGIILGWLAVTMLVLVIVREWRKPGYFFILLIASVLGAILLSGIYVEVARPLAEWIGGVNVTESTGWRVFHIVVSNVILLGTPVGIIVGLAGFIIMSIWKFNNWRHQRMQRDST